MKIAIGSIAQESNSFSPFTTRLDHFTCLRGEAVLDKFKDAVNIFAEAGHEAVPTLSVYALPGGAVQAAAFLSLCDELVAAVPADIDGVWLMLHGALFVKGLDAASPSGEEYLLSRLREKLGDKVPIAACMDMHGNHTAAFIRRINIVRGYHTAPHEDWDYQNCCRITARALLQMLAGRRLRCWHQPLPLRLPGERFMTDFAPAKQTVALSEALEAEPGVICATVFAGMAWCDCSYNTLSVVLTVDDSMADPAALAAPLIAYVMEQAGNYRIPVANLPLIEALDCCETAAERPFFISDSGDNVTAGAAGDSALCLSALLAGNRKGYLVAGIADKPFVEAYYDCPADTLCTLPLGGKTDPGSPAVHAEGRLLASACLDVGASREVRCLLAAYGGNQVIITEERCDFVVAADIEAMAGPLASFTGVIVKLGYLFPGLQAAAKGSCIALTAGSCNLDIGTIPYTAPAWFEDESSFRLK